MTEFEKSLVIETNEDDVSLMKFKKSLITETDGLMGPLARGDMMMMKTQVIATVHVAVREVNKTRQDDKFTLRSVLHDIKVKFS